MNRKSADDAALFFVLLRCKNGFFYSFNVRVERRAASWRPLSDALLGIIASETPFALLIRRICFFALQPPRPWLSPFLNGERIVSILSASPA